MRYTWLFVLLFLVGCSSPSHKGAIKYYQFSSADRTMLQRDIKSSPFILQINPVHLEGLVNQRGIVMQLPDHQMYAANYHVWADLPGNMLTNTAQRQLLNRLPQWLVVKSDALHTDDSQQAFYQLDIRLNEFNGFATNTARVSGIWQLSRVNNSGKIAIVQLHRFHQEVPLKADGYVALVAALQLGWQQVLQQVSQNIAALHTAQ
ncbi:MAG: hypothetical protein CSA60_02790 [Neptuniibacter caesariensis]|uniref:ABC-type transport auxiliary lipoprotein component domain-containing protein n=1 Tax=Neptuniibacter caesariensis TaxID=207954 RepID=A0A2G6JNB1_NEPCE|nr:MAG: hypothetical protein CSA60_02790 [Neptuniibacter caesariensis]